MGRGPASPAPARSAGRRARRGRMTGDVPRLGVPGVGALRGVRGGRSASPAAPPAARARRIARRRTLRHDGRLGRLLLDEAAVGQALERDPQAGGHVSDGVERPVVRHDLDEIAGPRGGQPDPRGDRDAQVAPVADARGRGAVDQVRAALREQPRRLVADHPPVGDGHELGPAVPGIDAEMVDDVRQVLRAAGVLDVQEDRAPAGGARPLRLGGRHAPGEGGLDGGEGEVERFGLGAGDDWLGRSGSSSGRATDPVRRLPAGFRARRRAGGASSRLPAAAVAIRADRHVRPTV